MEQRPNNTGSKQIGDKSTAEVMVSTARKTFLQRSRKIVLLFFIIPILVILLGGSLLLFVFQGEEINSTAIDNRVHAAITGLLGDQFDVSIEGTGLSLISSSALTLTANGVEISHAEDKTQVARLDDVEVGLNLLSVLQGAPKFDRLTVSGGRVDVQNFRRENTQSVSPTERLAQMAKALSNVENAFVDGAIRSIKLADINIVSAKLLRRDAGEIMVRRGEVSLDEDEQINLVGDLSTDRSTIQLSSKWRGNSEGGKQLSFGIGGLDLMEWFETAEITPNNEKGLGISGNLRVDGRIPFDADLNPTKPFAKFQSANGKFRLGDKSNVDVHSAVFNIGLAPDTGEIDILQSQISAGERAFAVTGQIEPIDQAANFQGLLALQFDVESMLEPEERKQDISVSGVFDQSSQMLSLDQILVDNDGQKLAGYLGLGFSNTSASLSGKLTSTMFSIENLDEVWPFHIAPDVQKWVKQNLSGGQLENLAMSFDVPKGRFAELPNVDGFAEGEMTITSNFAGAEIKTPGDLPPLTNAAGTFQLDSNSLAADLSRGELNADGAGTIAANAARLTIQNIFAKGLPTELETTLSGTLSDMAIIADKEPLTIAKNIGVKPRDLVGNASAALNLAFNAQAKGGDNELVWNAKVKLDKAGSKTRLLDRQISNANVNIIADPTSINVVGTATLDGVEAKLNVTEPINGGAQKLRKGEVEMSLSHSDLAKQGIDVDPVVKGQIGVKISAVGNGDSRYELDLRNADLSLPWISWIKGKGIPASASFLLAQKDGRNTLSDFRFSGTGGLNAAGRLVFDKDGLVSARLSDIKLTGQDRFNIEIDRGSNRYKIAASGAAFEGRSIIDQVIHKDGFASEKSTTDVSLSANFGRLIGFQKQVMENAVIRYRTDGGLLTEFKVRGALNGELSQIDAARNGNSTTFDFNAKDAGASLGMVNIYTKMRGGSLKSTLTRVGEGAFSGKVKLRDFVIVGEERLRSLVAAPVSERGLQRAAGKIQELDVQEVKFRRMEATITKSDGYLGVKDGTIRNRQIGLTFDGVLFDQSDQMSVRGTFMPLFSISRLIGEIPILGDILGNGKNSGLIGITYRLKGAANNPQIAVNPISVIAPGIFRRIFEFQE